MKKRGVHRLGKFTFKGGSERQYIKNIDPYEIQRSCMEKRVALQQMTGDVSVIRECEGHRIKFTQKQIRSFILYTDSVD